MSRRRWAALAATVLALLAIVFEIIAEVVSR